MDEDLVSTYLRAKVSSNLRQAEQEAGRSSSIISRFQSLERQILEKYSSGCGIPVDLLHEVMGALSDSRVFNYERPTAKAAVSKKAFFDFIRLLRRPLSEFLFKRKMIKQLNPIEEKLRSLSPTAAPGPPVAPQSETTVSISEHFEIIGLEEEAAQIEKWLTLSSSDKFTEIVITGKWGCGKTALAQKVFASSTIEKEFSPLIWVCLSGTMHEHEHDHEARVRVVRCIQGKIGQDKWDELSGKRYLMVLDDWPGEVDLDLPKGRGGALILTTRRDNDFGTDHNHVMRLQPRLSDHNCWQIFSNAAHQQAKLDTDEPLLSTIRKDVIRNSRRQALAVKTLGTIIPHLLLQRKHWVPARGGVDITWVNDTKYWIWRKEGKEEVAELVAVCWLEMQVYSKSNMFLMNKSYSAYLVYKLKEERQNLDGEMLGSICLTINGKEKWSNRKFHIDGDGLVPVPWDEAEAEDEGWMEIKIGEFSNNFISDGSAQVRVRLFENGDWKSGLVVRGVSYRLNVD